MAKRKDIVDILKKKPEGPRDDLCRCCQANGAQRDGHKT